MDRIRRIVACVHSPVRATVDTADSEHRAATDVGRGDRQAEPTGTDHDNSRDEVGGEALTMIHPGDAIAHGSAARQAETRHFLPPWLPRHRS